MKKKVQNTTGNNANTVSETAAVIGTPNLKKYHFSKIFELGEYQVLITKEYEPDDDSFKVVQTTDLEDCRPSVALGFKDEDKCNKCFEDYTLENAQKFLDNIKLMLEE